MDISTTKKRAEQLSRTLVADMVIMNSEREVKRHNMGDYLVYVGYRDLKYNTLKQIHSIMDRACSLTTLDNGKIYIRVSKIRWENK